MLGITGKESLNGIHSRFHALVKEWHPDVSLHGPDLSDATFIRIEEACTVLVGHGMNVKLSFNAEDVRNVSEYDSRECWMSHFGDDPIWG